MSGPHDFTLAEVRLLAERDVPPRKKLDPKAHHRVSKLFRIAEGEPPAGYWGGVCAMANCPFTVKGKDQSGCGRPSVLMGLFPEEGFRNFKAGSWEGKEWAPVTSELLARGCPICVSHFQLEARLTFLLTGKLPVDALLEQGQSQLLLRKGLRSKIRTDFGTFSATFARLVPDTAYECALQDPDLLREDTRNSKECMRNLGLKYVRSLEHWMQTNLPAPEDREVEDRATALLVLPEDDPRLRIHCWPKWTSTEKRKSCPGQKRRPPARPGGEDSEGNVSVCRSAAQVKAEAKK
jgi:hypothetical protein